MFFIENKIAFSFISVRICVMSANMQLMFAMIASLATELNKKK